MPNTYTKYAQLDFFTIPMRYGCAGVGVRDRAKAKAISCPVKG